MAASRRRTSRKKPASSNTAQRRSPSENGDESGTEAGDGQPDNGSVQEQQQQEKDACPACINDDVKRKAREKEASEDSAKDTWIRCDACKQWFHWQCVAEENQDHEAVGHWYCKPCRDADPSRVITFKPPARKSSRKKTARDYASLNVGMASDPDKWTKLMENKRILPNKFPKMKGKDLTLDWLNSDENALREPVIIESPDGLGMKMPGKDFEVRDILEELGGETPVEVIDVHTQSGVRDWNLNKWVNYYYTEPKNRDRIRNVISLEVSDTELANRITPPRIFRELDWVTNYWPPGKRSRGQVYPKVQLYCLMGVARAWTDWHVDFAGSSVYYHILRGAKTFYFIRPSPANLHAYERWSGSETQNHVWLGDMVDEVVKVELHRGNTMIIPTGWIHAVHTPEDSLVFGGNFLHSYNVATQLRIREIEIATQVPKKFRFPLFTRLCWYVAEQALRDLKSKEDFPARVLESVEALSHFLVSEVRAIERGSESSRRESKEMVPSDKVKDPSALARELRWRVRLALGSCSGDEGKSRSKSTAAATAPAVNGVNKRKRDLSHASQSAEPESVSSSAGNFRHFKPKDWDLEKRLPGGASKIYCRKSKPAGEKATVEWMDWLPENSPNGIHEPNGGNTRPEEGDGEDAEVELKRDVAVRARQYVQNGVVCVERHRAERLLEIWRWPPGRETEAADAKLTSEVTVE